jgi:hypothetical protein
MEKDKWSQTVKAFQLSIGVPDNGLGQVGLYYSKGIPFLCFNASP